MFIPVILAVLKEKQKLFIQFEKDAIPHIDLHYNFALRITGNKKYAIKLLLETYKRAFRFFEMLDESINRKDWLFRVMRNAYFNIYSKKSKESAVMDNAEVENFYENMKDSSSDISSLEKELHDNLSDNELSNILSSLPEDFKMVIILCDIAGFKYEEIADFVDIPVGIVKSRLKRGRKMLFMKLCRK